MDAGDVQLAKVFPSALWQKMKNSENLTDDDKETIQSILNNTIHNPKVRFGAKALIMLRKMEKAASKGNFPKVSSMVNNVADKIFEDKRKPIEDKIKHKRDLTVMHYRSQNHDRSENQHAGRKHKAERTLTPESQSPVSQSLPAGSQDLERLEESFSSLNLPKEEQVALPKGGKTAESAAGLTSTSIRPKKKPAIKLDLPQEQSHKEQSPMKSVEAGAATKPAKEKIDLRVEVSPDDDDYESILSVSETYDDESAAELTSPAMRPKKKPDDAGAATKPAKAVEELRREELPDGGESILRASRPVSFDKSLNDSLKDIEKEVEGIVHELGDVIAHCREIANNKNNLNKVMNFVLNGDANELRGINENEKNAVLAAALKLRKAVAPTTDLQSGRTLPRGSAELIKCFLYRGELEVQKKEAHSRTGLDVARVEVLKELMQSDSLRTSLVQFFTFGR